MKKITNEKIFELFNFLNSINIETSYSHRFKCGDEFKRIGIIGIKGSKFSNGLQQEDYEQLVKGLKTKFECLEVKDDKINKFEIYFLPSYKEFLKLFEII